MTGFRVSTSLWTIGLAALLALGARAAEPTPPAASAPPRGLATELPPDDVQTQTGPSDAAPEAAEQTLPDQAGRPSGPRVTMTGLTAINPDSAGLITDASGGFAASLWRGSQRSAVTMRLTQLPSAPSSPAMQGLLRRLLLTSASPPAGA